MLKHQVEVALEELGGTSSQIAESLIKKGIKGQRSNCFLCPLAAYLLTLPGITNIMISKHNKDSQFSISSYGEVIPCSPWINAFINDFDNGKFPQLEYPPPWEEDYC